MVEFLLWCANLQSLRDIEVFLDANEKQRRAGYKINNAPLCHSRFDKASIRVGVFVFCVL